MQFHFVKTSLSQAVSVALILLFGASLAAAQQQINLTAAPSNLMMPDGNTVPMWGYTCGAAVSGSTATCAPLNAGPGWSPVVITVPTGASGGLTVNLTNTLSFSNSNSVPTSLVVVGQLGGGLGTTASSTPSPDHSSAQQVTWPIASPGAANTPPPQGPRVQSFSTEVAAGATTALNWASLRPGTYLLESGTHPSIQGPMGLYGILVVTTAPAGATAGTAYPAAGAVPAVTYNAEIPLLFSEIDPIQNAAVSTAVNTAGFSETAVWSGQPGGCGNPSSSSYQTCYPPAVNYTPLYYLINGVAFNRSAPAASLFPVAPATGVTSPGSVLVRLVNAGLRMHVPSIVGSQTGSATPPANGFSLIAEDGNPLPGIPRVQSEVFMAAGETYDVMVNVPGASATALPIFDRELSLSGNAVARDSGMLAYISVNGAKQPNTGAFSPLTATAKADSYNLIAGQTLTVSDASKGVMANDINIFSVRVATPPAGAAVVSGVTQFTFNPDGTFTYTPGTGVTSDSFTYCGNGATSGASCATVTLANCATVSGCMEANTGITVRDDSYASNLASSLSIKQPGVLANDFDGAGYPLSVATGSYAFASGPSGGTLSVLLDKTGAFNASASTPGTYTFTYKAQNSQGTVSATAATVTLTFPAATGLNVTVLDPVNNATITDYRWVIEEDRTFYVDPTKTTNNGGTSIVPTFGTNFHTSYMPLIATGCTGPLSCESGQTVFDPATGGHINAVCDIGNGVCRADTTGNGEAQELPSNVALDPNKRYYISILPGDAGNPFANGYASAPVCDPTGAPNTTCGHGMGGAPITLGQTSVTIMTQAAPYPPAKLSVFVFEDDFPLNGEQDGGGGVDVLSPNEPGLGGFNITLFDDAGGTGDATGQMTYDMFNMPLSNSLAGTVDPSTGFDACPIGSNTFSGTAADNTALIASETTGVNGVQGNLGITGTIVTCPKYEADGKTLSPLAGQAVIANLMPGRYGVVATPAADRIGRGEEWLQTNTLDGQKAHDSFLRIGEPSFFQEFGPAGYHVSIGFANPAIINARQKYVCNGTDPNITGANCTNSVTAVVTTERMSRTPDERLYSSGDNSSFSFTQCYVSFGDPDGEDFAFTKCDQNGKFTLTGLPDGDWRITVFDQWNDMLVDGLSTPVRLSGGKLLDMGQIAMNQWQSNIYTKTFFDLNGNGIQDPGEAGLTLVATNNRFRDGSYSNFNNTDLSGNAGFNEIFPLFSWYVIETDSTRYKSTGAHVVYDAGGPADGNPCGATANPPTAPCGSSSIGGMMANTAEQISLPSDLQVPGARYCNSADCPDGDNSGGSTGRVDPPTWFNSYGWQGFSGQNNFIEFGKKPFAVGETGGIHGEVIYASTRPFDDPTLLIHTSWTPDVPGVTINLYQEGTAPDGSTSLKLIDTTKTSSWDDWAQGFHTGPNGTAVPNMNCPGQGKASGTDADLFFFTLFDQPMWLDVYGNGGTPANTIPYDSQYKCFDGMHNWNQVQPAPYDGYYTFPSVTSIDPVTGKPTGTNCTACVSNPDTTDAFRVGTPMLPPGKYVVEMIVPPGYELVKEEDKNILIGDNYIAPVTQQFGGLGSIFILPDQAEVKSLYNATNPQNPTETLGRTSLPTSEGDTGSVETFWPCVGASRIVPDYISLFPQSGEVAPFAGATRNLCDRKEVTLTEQSSALAKFWIFTSAHVAAHFTGVITDDYTSEFDPFSPQFGEKFSPPNLPVSIKDWTGREVSRVYSDQWGTYNGLTYSTWEVNPPNPTGYAPTMMVVCMNDPGPIPGPNGTMIQDPLYNPQYSQFCYEIPFMPGQTQYMDTPVVPTSAFAGAGYNNPDCSYPDATPAVSEVDGDGVGPWVGASGHTLTIHALGVQNVPNNAYTGPSATGNPFNLKTVARNYGFGATRGTVTIGGVNAAITSWSDSVITVTAPATGGNNGVAACNIQQQTQYKPVGTTTAYCGQLVVTRGDNQKQSVDTVTVTIGGKAPTHIAASDSIQTAIDLAKPGDLLIVDPTCTPTAGGTAVACSSTALNGAAPSQAASQAAHFEMVLMWKPVRLQGVGAASSIINANTQPAGKMDPWRARVDCLFGLAPAGTPKGYDPSCGAGWFGFKPTTTNPQVDRLPLEATVGWDATLNGNLAELLQEPTLMGALEGAAITVLSKGVQFPNGSNPFAADTFPVGTTLLQNVPRVSSDHCSLNPNPYPSNFECNPSSIDALGITDSSQGGGGIFVHAWGHNLQIANNRINSNAGTLSGGINVGQGEFPGAYFGGFGVANADPGSCVVSNTTNLQLPYCFDMNVNVHHNMITSNSSTGDELFSATPAGAGGVSFCTGTDYYQFNYNWLCGNLSSGDGGGLGQLGFVYHGDIEHNTIIFNQSTNPTIPANGGGIAIMGAPDVDPTCGATTDQDCVPTPGSVGPSDGTGPGLVINANLIMGNAAESGSGGGLRLQNINGSDVVNFPRTPTRWNDVTVTNNVIVNNVAGWDGAGISLLDALNVNIINNTVMSNDTTASAGVLFNTLGAPLASSSGPTCTSNCGTTSAAQPAGLVSIQNSSVLTSNLPATITCPARHFAGNNANNGSCRRVSYPELYNDVFFDNRAFYIGVGTLGSGTQNQQNVVALYNAFTTTQAGNQSATGSCPSGVSYWDIGVRGDTGPTNHASGVTLSPEASLLTNITGYAGGGTGFRINTAANPAVVSQYCNGSRVPPEAGPGNWGWQVPPGISDATVPNPIFNLTPAATIDEGNNWINISWGPLAETNATTGAVLGNYGPTSASPVINYITNANSATTYAVAPSTDFFGNLRKTNGAVDIGAIEFANGPATAILNVTPTSLTFTGVVQGTTSSSQALTLHNTGTGGATGVAVAVNAPFSRPAGAAGGTCGTTLAAGSTCTINIVYSPSAGVTNSNGTATITANVAVSGSPVTLTGTAVAPVISASWTPTSHNFLNATRGVGALGAPTQVFTLTNSGNVNLNLTNQATLTGTDPTEFSIVRLLSTCGPAGGGQILGQTTLAPGANCTVTVQFRPQTTQTTGAKSANLSITDAAGTQTAGLTGTAQ